MSPRAVWVTGTAIALLTPPLVFCIAGLGEGMSAGTMLAACIEQFAARRQNLGVVALLGLIPLALLAAVLWLARRLGWRRLGDTLAAIAGLIPILVVLVWINCEFWPLFLPERVYPGFPHGLELVLGPFVFAPLAMTLGLSFRALLWRSS